MKNLSMIMAHKEAQETVRRHLPFWIKENPRIIFTCPQDSMITSDYPVVGIGSAGHHSVKAIQRFKSILKFMTCLRADWYTLHEYDSLIFESVENLPSEPNALYCNQNPKQQKPLDWEFSENINGFKGWYFPHPPLRMDHVTLCRLVEAFESEPDDCEKGFWDRAVGYVCDKNNIKMIGWAGLGCSHNTIHAGHLLDWAVEKRKAGAVCYHGIKDKEVLEALKVDPCSVGYASQQG